MKKAKINKVKKEEIKEEVESYSLKNLIIIILIVALVFGIFYFITTLFVHPTKNSNTSDNTNYEVEAGTIPLNHLLDRNENEYYVIAYKTSSNNILSQVNYFEIYQKYISNYSSKDDSLKFYKVDLNDIINKNYLSDEANITNSLEQLKLNDETLFKIVDGKISEYYIGYNEIIKELSQL